ncbi:uncharacterized protein LOC116010527 [Ipomoea triloba]|uniref:uncharacterized protein LOC116010527 n=1 Tax=Ipomoea triloba TaxID=35885 RepID=UPI00125D9D0D|nr:uncharacterized protein LOC116010527 [Ipomoea triloba]
MRIRFHFAASFPPSLVSLYLGSSVRRAQNLIHHHASSSNLTQLPIFHYPLQSIGERETTLSRFLQSSTRFLQLSRHRREPSIAAAISTGCHPQPAVSLRRRRCLVEKGSSRRLLFGKIEDMQPRFECKCGFLNCSVDLISHTDSKYQDIHKDLELQEQIC